MLKPHRTSITTTEEWSLRDKGHNQVWSQNGLVSGEPSCAQPRQRKQSGERDRPHNQWAQQTTIKEVALCDPDAKVDIACTTKTTGEPEESKPNVGAKSTTSKRRLILDQMQAEMVTDQTHF